MESKNEMHLSLDKLVKLVKTVKFLVGAGRPEEQINEDLKQCHGLTENDLKKLWELV